jgi:hypothetical protein
MLANICSRTNSFFDMTVFLQNYYAARSPTRGSSPEGYGYPFILSNVLFFF